MLNPAYFALLESIPLGVWLALLVLIALLAWGGSGAREDMAECSFFCQKALAEFPALSGFSSRLLPPERARARFHSPSGEPLWDRGDGWIECEFLHGPNGLAALALDPSPEAYPLPACQAARQAQEIELSAALAPRQSPPSREPLRL